MTDDAAELLELFNECLDILICLENPELGDVAFMEESAAKAFDAVLLNETFYVSPMKMAMHMRRVGLKPKRIARLDKAAAAKKGWSAHRSDYVSGVRKFRSSYRGRKRDRTISRGMSLFGQLNKRE